MLQIYSDFLQHAIISEARFDDKYVHIGAFDYTADGKFRWVIGQTPLQLTANNWLPNNPRGKGRRCSAMMIYDMDKYGMWADSYCWVNLPFVCEVQISYEFA